MVTTNQRLTALEDSVLRMDKDMHQMKNDMQDLTASFRKVNRNIATISDAADDINKIWKWIKAGLPLVATAAITSGLVSGRWGAFLHALMAG